MSKREVKIAAVQYAISALLADVGKKVVPAGRAIALVLHQQQVTYKQLQ